MENWLAIQMIAKQRHCELEAEAKRIRLIKESRKGRDNKRISKFYYKIINFIGRCFETFGRSLQKKAQTC